MEKIFYKLAASDIQMFSVDFVAEHAGLGIHDWRPPPPPTHASLVDQHAHSGSLIKTFVNRFIKRSNTNSPEYILLQ